MKGDTRREPSSPADGPAKRSPRRLLAAGREHLYRVTDFWRRAKSALIRSKARVSSFEPLVGSHRGAFDLVVRIEMARMRPPGKQAVASGSTSTRSMLPSDAVNVATPSMFARSLVRPHVETGVDRDAELVQVPADERRIQLDARHPLVPLPVPRLDVAPRQRYQEPGSWPYRTVSWRRPGNKGRLTFCTSEFSTGVRRCP